MAIDYRIAYCEMCEKETKQWKPAHRALWNCDTCNTSNLDKNGRYNCFNSLEECVNCDMFLTCLGRLDEELLEKVTRFREARERLEKQPMYKLEPAGKNGGDLDWKAVDEGPDDDREERVGEQKKVQVWLYSETEEGPGVHLFKLVAGRGAFWQPITGRVEETEATIEEAAIREVKEETGMEIDPGGLLPLDHGFSYYDERRGILYHEHTFAAKVEADFRPRLSGEHTGWARFSPGDAVEALPWPEQRAALEGLMDVMGWNAGEEKGLREKEGVRDHEN